jgi:hypothetical protein
MDGLTGLAGLQQIEEDTPEASPEARMGDTVDPAHGKTGEQATPYSWESQQTQAGSHEIIPFEVVDDEEIYAILNSGMLTQDPTSERVPWTHAAPWPKDPIGDGSVSPDNTVRQVLDNAAIHAIDTGGQRNVYSPTMYAQNDSWNEIWEVDPNSVDLSEVPAQMKSGAAPGGRGHTDRTQSNATQNQYGFDSRHMHRRYATGSVPGNYMWMRPGGRPMIKSLAGPARPAIGGNSPFAGDNLGQAFGLDGAILAQPSVQYQPPPEPYIASSFPSTEGPSDYTDFYGV